MPCESVLVKKNALALLFHTVLVVEEVVEEEVVEEVGGEEQPDFSLIHDIQMSAQRHSFAVPGPGRVNVETVVMSDPNISSSALVSWPGDATLICYRHKKHSQWVHTQYRLPVGRRKPRWAGP